MNVNEPWTPSLLAELKATTILSIRDTLRQRGLSVEDAASIIGMHADELRAIVEARQVRHVSLEALEDIIEALDRSGRQP